MTIQTPAYATREQVKRALDYKETARNDAQVDRAVESGSRAVEDLCHRVFYPRVATRYFDWPDRNRSRSWRLWLHQHELVSVATLVVAGEALDPADYFLEPANSGPPYTHVEIDLSRNAAFSSGNTHQRAIAITGVWAGAPVDEAIETTISEDLDDSETGVDLAGGSEIDAGSLIRVGSERMLVTAVSDASDDALTAPLTASQNDVTVPVVDGSWFVAGETILIDSERMLVVAVSGDNLTVKRAWDGTVLATHALLSDVYSKRVLTVVRGAYGTTATTHTTGATVSRWLPPTLVRDYALAYAIDQLLQESSGYSRVVGSGEMSQEATGRALGRARAAAFASHGRKSRMRAV